MIEGPEHDDRYRMVEDELLSIAQKFTAHLYAVEYQRLKEASKSQNAKTIKDISRPVFGSMTDTVKRRQERKALDKNQRLALRKTSGNTDDTESESDHYRATSLYGLMESPRKKAARLDAVIATTMATRATAGFEETGMGSKKGVILPQLHDETTDGDDDDGDDDDDDLDAPGPSVMRKPVEKSTQPKAQLTQMKTGQQTVKSQTSTDINLRAVKKVAPASSKMELNDPPDDPHDDFFSRLQNRRASLKSNRERRKHRSTNTKPVPSNQDVIPGFL